MGLRVVRPVAVQGVVAVAAKMDDERVATLKAENGHNMSMSTVSVGSTLASMFGRLMKWVNNLAAS